MTPAQAKGISLRFKIRGSMASKIMTNGRGTDTLGETCKTYLDNWILEQPEFFGRPINEFSSKHTRKGNAVEKQALDFIGQQLYDGAFLTPNTNSFSNNYMTGTPDVILEDHTIDNKSSWTVASFPIFETAPKTDYWWQGQVYMHLTGMKQHKVIHTLMNTPDELINAEAYRLARELGFSEPSEELMQTTIRRLTFDDIPPERKIKVFEFQYDGGSIEKLEKRVEDCRNYIYNTLLLTTC